MQTKEEQIEKLRTFFSGEIFQQRKEWIRETCHPLIARASENDSWLLSTEEAETILHEYAPALSVVIEGPTMVVFFEKNKA